MLWPGRTLSSLPAPNGVSVLTLQSPAPDEAFERLLEVTGAAGAEDIAAGAPGVNVQHAAKGATPLMAAAVHGRDDIIATLLSNGADPAAVLPGAGKTARDLAEMYGHRGVVEALEEYEEQVRGGGVEGGGEGGQGCCVRQGRRAGCSPCLWGCRCLWLLSLTRFRSLRPCTHCAELSAAQALAAEELANAALVLSHYQGQTDADEVDLDLMEALLQYICQVPCCAMLCHAALC